MSVPARSDPRALASHARARSRSLPALVAVVVLVMALLAACGSSAGLPAGSPAAAAATHAVTTVATAPPSAPAATTTEPDGADGPTDGDPATGIAVEPEVRVPVPVLDEATPTGPAATKAPPLGAKYAKNLYRKGDFVAQYTFEWCVGASLQMALAITNEDGDTTRARQLDLWEMARDRSFSPFGGANPRGWTQALNDLGIGPYVLVSIPEYDEALRTAAAAIRATGRPVGLVMWRGRHAWVMSGFESRGDPRTDPDFVVTGVRVLDPLYPHGSSTWGPSPAPNSLLAPATLGKQFVVRDSRRVDLGVPPGYLLVLPTR